MIILNEISRSFKDKQVLKELTARFEDGTINTIIAPNGTGKTTLLSIISGLMIMDKGNVDYGEGGINDVALLLAGEKNLYMKNTVYENVQFFGTLAGIGKKELEESIDKYKSMFPLYEEKKNKLVEELSYGQKRMIALFASIVSNAKCILIDEVTEGLDLSNTKALINVLKMIKEDRTLILASHDYEFVSEVSDRLFFLKDGKFVQICNEKQDKDTVIEIYSKLYGVE